jgi:excisionase family DNA binding protein
METITISLQELQSIHSKLDNIGVAVLSNKTVLTFNDVAAYTGISKSYLYKLTSAGLIPHSKPNGKQLFFEKAEIDQWLLRNAVKTSQEIEAEAATYVTLKKNHKPIAV